MAYPRAGEFPDAEVVSPAFLPVRELPEPELVERQHWHSSVVAFVVAVAAAAAVGNPAVVAADFVAAAGVQAEGFAIPPVRSPKRAEDWR